MRTDDFRRTRKKGAAWRLRPSSCTRVSPKLFGDFVAVQSLLLRDFVAVSTEALVGLDQVLHLALEIELLG